MTQPDDTPSKKHPNSDFNFIGGVYKKIDTISSNSFKKLFITGIILSLLLVAGISIPAVSNLPVITPLIGSLTGLFLFFLIIGFGRKNPQNPAVTFFTNLKEGRLQADRIKILAITLATIVALFILFNKIIPIGVGGALTVVLFLGSLLFLTRTEADKEYEQELADQMEEENENELYDYDDSDEREE